MQFLIECYMATFIQLEKITDTVAIRLSNAPGYHRQASEWQEPRLLDELVPVAIDEVVKLVHLLPSKSSPEDFMPTTMLKSSVDVMAPLIARLANMSFSSGGCSLHHWSTFDTIDHYILLDRISSDFGICGSTLGWLQSFVTGRYKYIAVGAQKSGIPQGSVLDPLLFAMYISPISNVVTAHSLDHHQYADDTQLYMAVRPSADVTFTAVSECVEDVARWFLENELLLNPAKTEAVLFGTKAQHDKTPSASSILLLLVCVS